MGRSWGSQLRYWVQAAGQWAHRTPNGQIALNMFIAGVVLLIVAATLAIFVF